MSDDEKPSPGQPTQTLQRITAKASFQGPIPPPGILEGYENLVPGAADRLIRMAELQQEHDNAQDRALLAAEIGDHKAGRREALVGQIFGLIIGLAAIGGATFAAINGAQWFGAALGVGGIAGLVGVFVYGRRMEREAESDPTG